MNARFFKHLDRVVYITVSNPVSEHPTIKVRTGHISSTENSHVGVDNREKTVVWFDEVNNTWADSADDAHEASFKVVNPHLLRIEEIEKLKDSNESIKWFSMYSELVGRLIALSLTNFKFKEFDLKR